MGARVTVVTVTFRSSDTIAACINSLPPAAGACDVAAVVVDNASGDGTAEIVRELATGSPLPVALVENEENLGFAAAADAGLTRATGDYVLFLNPDTVLPERAIEDLVDVATSRLSAGVVSAALVNPDGSPQPMVEDDITLARALLGMVRLRQPVRPRPAPSAGPPVAVDWAHAACFLMPVDLVHRLGGFDERFFFGGEDMDLCRRVRAAGLEVVVAPDVRVEHAGGASVAAIGSTAHGFRVRAVATAFEIRYGRWAAVLFAVTGLLVYGLSGRRQQAAAAVDVLRRRAATVGRAGAVR